MHACVHACVHSPPSRRTRMRTTCIHTHRCRGRGFLIRNGTFQTADDALALNAHDYATSNPELGWVRDGVVEDCVDEPLPTSQLGAGFFARLLGGVCDSTGVPHPHPHPRPRPRPRRNPRRSPRPHPTPVTQGDTHPETLTAINNLAAHLPLHLPEVPGEIRGEIRGEMRSAEELYREALAGRRAVLGDHHPDTLTSINNLGMLLLSASRLKDAGGLLIEAFDGACLVFGTKHERTRAFRQNLTTARSVRMRARRWHATHNDD